VPLVRHWCPPKDTGKDPGCVKETDSTLCLSEPMGSREKQKKERERHHRRSVSSQISAKCRQKQEERDPIP